MNIGGLPEPDASPVVSSGKHERPPECLPDPLGIRLQDLRVLNQTIVE